MCELGQLHPMLNKNSQREKGKEERRYSTWWILYWIIRPTGFLLLLPIYIVHLVYAYFKDLTQWVVNKISYALLKPELQSEPSQVKASDLKSHGKSYEKILTKYLSTDKKRYGYKKR